jgi:hypothetical protein
MVQYLHTVPYHPGLCYVYRNTKKKYQVMRFTSSVNVDFGRWTQVKMERENNMKEFRGTEEEMPKSVLTTRSYI